MEGTLRLIVWIWVAQHSFYDTEIWDGRRQRKPDLCLW